MDGKMENTDESNMFRVFVIVSGLVGNPESSLFHRRSPKFINESTNSKFWGLSLSNAILVVFRFRPCKCVLNSIDNDYN